MNNTGVHLKEWWFCLTYLLRDGFTWGGLHVIDACKCNMIVDYLSSFTWLMLIEMFKYWLYIISYYYYRGPRDVNGV